MERGNEVLCRMLLGEAAGTTGYTMEDVGASVDCGDEGKESQYGGFLEAGLGLALSNELYMKIGICKRRRFGIRHWVLETVKVLMSQSGFVKCDNPIAPLQVVGRHNKNEFG